MGNVIRSSRPVQEDKALFDVIWAADLRKSCFSTLLPTMLWQFYSPCPGVCIIISDSWQWKPHCFSESTLVTVYVHRKYVLHSGALRWPAAVTEPRHMQLGDGAILAALWCTRLPVVAHVHRLGLEFLHLPSKSKFITTWFEALLNKWAFQPMSVGFLVSFPSLGILAPPENIIKHRRL